MDWKEQLKSNPVVTGLVWIVGIIITGVGAINSFFELAGQDAFKSSDGGGVSIYLKLTGWLSAELALPIWVILPAIALAVLSVVKLWRQRTCLKSLSAELELLKNPPCSAIPQLDSTDERVLFWATHIYDSSSTGMGPTPGVIASAASIRLTAVETALDVLKQSGLVRLKKLKNAPIDLTPEGRLYLKRPDISTRYSAFIMNIIHKRI
jgi:hypothetical protein